MRTGRGKWDRMQRDVSEDLLRDLVQCVQAARDGAEDGSLFAIQCDLVLARATGEVCGLLLPRSVQQPSLFGWGPGDPINAPGNLEQ
jgi:hypothetical protein